LVSLVTYKHQLIIDDIDLLVIITGKNTIYSCVAIPYISKVKVIYLKMHIY